MKIIKIIPGQKGKQSFIFSQEQGKLLQSRGFDISYFFISTEMRILDVIREFKKIRAAIDEIKPDIVHTHYGVIYGFISIWASNVPSVITFHGNDLNPHPLHSKLMSLIARTLSQLAAMKADGIICVSPELKERLWWKRDMAKIIPMGVNRNIFFPIDKSEARKSLGWRDDERVVLFYSGGDPVIKRFDFAKEVVKKAEKLCGQIRMENLEGGVSYDKMPLYINAADCYLLTSVNEGSPCMVKEAICCGVPVVSVDVGDVAIRFKKIKGARVINNSIDDLAQAICDVFSGENKFYSKAAAEEIDEEKLLDEVIEIYKDVVK
jgi:teichuronic acid biosynthesis glycosyltransferase TuaC